MLNRLANFLDDLNVKINILTFKINQLIKAIDEKCDKYK